MKKFIFLLSLTLLFGLTSLFGIAGLAQIDLTSHASTQYYAKVKKSDVYLYASADETHPIFELPATYFVLLSEQTNDNFYKATYLDKVGYVKVEEVLPMDGKPLSPYAKASVMAGDPKGLDLNESPKIQNTQLVASVPYLSTSLVYYGEIEGENTPFNTKTWYYCKYANADESFEGYVYSHFCKITDEITLNEENFPLVTHPFLPPSASGEGLSDVAKTFIILGACLPCALLIYLLIKPGLLGHKEGKEKPKKLKRRRHGDYFEFDENDLT